MHADSRIHQGIYEVESLQAALDHCKQNIKKVFECGIRTSNENIPSNLGKDYKPGTSLRVWKDYFKNTMRPL